MSSSYSRPPDNLIWQTALAVAADTRPASSRPSSSKSRTTFPSAKDSARAPPPSPPASSLPIVCSASHWKPHRILDEAARIEGHPDNVAACVLGSIVASAIDAGGVARAVRLELPERVCHRHRGSRFRTAHGGGSRRPARLLHPRRCRFQRPAFRSADCRAGNRHNQRLSHGPSGPLPSALPHALMPGLDEILRLRAPGLLGCALSGAGPSILVFYRARVRTRLRPGPPDVRPPRPRRRGVNGRHRPPWLRAGANLTREAITTIAMNFGWAILAAAGALLRGAVRARFQSGRQPGARSLHRNRTQ